MARQILLFISAKLGSIVERFQLNDYKNYTKQLHSSVVKEITQLQSILDVKDSAFTIAVTNHFFKN